MTVHQKRIGTKIKCSVTGESYNAYIPNPLPPKPSLEMEKIYPLLDHANIALGRLDGLSILLPDPSLFLYTYVRKEAVLSSQIEGTQSTLSDLLQYENKEIIGIPNQDVVEVSNYVAAMMHGLKRVRSGFPLSMRLIREMHEIVLQKSRGSTKEPGEFRRSQNWVGGTRPGNAKFVPPPPEKVLDLLSDLEKFLHDETIKLPILIKAALAHHQFETIHPFLDGNGRLGRLLITFILCVDGIMKEPLLYLSLYFKTYRQSYYDHLQLVRDTGDWEEWVHFFLNGVIYTANQAVETSQKILELFIKDQQAIEVFGKSSASMLLIHNFLKKNIIIEEKKITEICNITLPTVNKSLQHLEEMGIVRESTGKIRNKIYVYQEYLNILNDGTNIN